MFEAKRTRLGGPQAGARLPTIFPPTPPAHTCPRGFPTHPCTQTGAPCSCSLHKCSLPAPTSLLPHSYQLPPSTRCSLRGSVQKRFLQPGTAPNWGDDLGDTETQHPCIRGISVTSSRVWTGLPPPSACSPSPRRGCCGLRAGGPEPTGAALSHAVGVSST